MARVTDGGISGAIDQLVYYTMNGKRYVRMRPAPSSKKKKLSPLQTLSTQAFGFASACGSGMLNRLRGLLLFPCTLATHNSLRGWMRKQYFNHINIDWNISSKEITMFQLNPAVDLRDVLKADIQVTDGGGGKIKVSVGELNPRKQLHDTPMHPKAVNIKLIALTSPFDKDRISVEFCKNEYKVEYINTIIPATDIVLDTKGEPGHIAVVVVAIEFNMGGGIMADGYDREPCFLPAAIIAMGRLLP